MVTYRVFIAGKFSARERLLTERARLRERGFGVVSTWLDEENGLACDEMQIAKRDLHDIIEANLFIIDTLDESSTGGREVELGFATALAMYNNKLVIVIGPIRNVYHSLFLRYGTWDAFFDDARFEEL